MTSYPTPSSRAQSGTSSSRGTLLNVDLLLLHKADLRSAAVGEILRMVAAAAISARRMSVTSANDRQCATVVATVEVVVDDLTTVRRTAEADLAGRLLRAETTMDGRRLLCRLEGTTERLQEPARSRPRRALSDNLLTTPAPPSDCNRPRKCKLFLLRSVAPEVARRH